MARISKASAILGPCVAIAASVALTACSVDDPAHRSFRPLVITASGVAYNGNGIAALDPEAIVTRTVKATSSAPTVHVSGTLTGVPVPAEISATGGSDGDGSGSGSDSGSGSGSDDDDSTASSSPSTIPTAPGTLNLDMVFTQFGAVGDVTTGSATSRLLRVEDEVWTAEPSSFWAAAGAVNDGRAYGGLYVKVPVADPRYAGFSDDTRIGFLLDHLLQTSATWTKGTASTVNGAAAIELSGTGRDGHRASIWVATDGEPYILRIAPTGGSYHGQIDFTDYENRYAVQAPLPGQVLDNALIVLPSLSPSTLQTSTLPVPSRSESPTPSTSSAAPPPSPSQSPSGSPSPSPSEPSASPSASPSESASASAHPSKGGGGGGIH